MSTTKDVFIIGGSQTDFLESYSDNGKNIHDLFKTIVESTLEQTGIDYDEINRLKKNNRIEIFVGNFASELFIQQGHLGPFLTQVDEAFVGIPAARYEAACASSTLCANIARSRIRANEIDLAIIVGIEIMRNVTPLVANDYLGACADYDVEAKGTRFFYPLSFGHLTDAYLNKYKDISEEKLLSAFMEISLKNRNNASHNPLAQTRNADSSRKHLEVMNRKYKNAFGGRTRFSDCSQISDGASSLLIASPEYTQEYLSKRGKDKSSVARIAGSGFRVAELHFQEKIEASKDNPYILPWGRQTVVDAFNEAKVTLDDINCIELHDCFAINEYVIMSNFGITKPGEEYIAVEKGVTQKTGATPINASGGLMGAGHPVGASGARMLLDIYKQITNQAGDYQIDNAKRGATFNVGGSCTTTMSMVLENAALSH